MLPFFLNKGQLMTPFFTEWWNYLFKLHTSIILNTPLSMNELITQNKQYSKLYMSIQHSHICLLFLSFVLVTFYTFYGRQHCAYVCCLWPVRTHNASRTPTTEGIIYQSPRTREPKHSNRVEMHSLINIADEVSSHLKTVNLKMGHRSSTVTELTNKQECDKLDK